MSVPNQRAIKPRGWIYSLIIISTLNRLVLLIQQLEVSRSFQIEEMVSTLSVPL